MDYWATRFSRTVVGLHLHRHDRHLAERGAELGVLSGADLQRKLNSWEAHTWISRGKNGWYDHVHICDAIHLRGDSYLDTVVRQSR